MTNTILIMFCWVLLGLACQTLARKKQRDTTIWFFLGFLGGVIALIVIFFLKPLRKSKKNIKENREPKNFLVLNKDNNYWYYLDNQKKQIGPMSLKKLFDDYLKGKITIKTFVWNDTMTEWKKLKEVPAISNIL